MVSCNGQEAKTQNYKNNKRTVYGMDLSVPGPYELYINDIAARKDYTTGMHNTFIEINPYVLKSGTYDFTLRLLPEPSEAEKGGIQPSTAEFLKVAVSSYEKTGDKTQAKSFKEIQSYPITKIKEHVPFVEVKGKFTVDLPYELEGWSNGQDLSKMNKEELEKKVVAFYEKTRNTMNSGNAEAVWEIKNENGSLSCHYQGLYAKIETKLESTSNNGNALRNNGNNAKPTEFLLHDGFSYEFKLD